MENKMEFISIKLNYRTDENGIRIYDYDEMRNQFEQHMLQCAANTQGDLDGWSDKQADYAMDNMTADDAFLHAKEIFQ